MSFLTASEGYLNSGPAPASLQIFDPSSNSYSPSYTPLPPTATITQTMPGPSRATTPNTGSFTMTQPGGGVHPTSTTIPGGNGNDGGGKKKALTGVILGTTLGLLSVMAAGILVIIYSRRRRRTRDGRFMPVGGDEGDDSSSIRTGFVIPPATRHDEKGVPGASGWASGLITAALSITGTAGAATKSRNARNMSQRRDMLADEDTREFGEWYNARRRDGTGGSSWSLNRMFGGRFRSREPSILSHGSHRQERTDPFSDGASLMYNDDSATPGIGTSTRPHNRRQTSYFSTGSQSYVDPFADPIREDKESKSFDDLGHGNDDYEHTSAVTTTFRPPPLFPTIRTVLPVPLVGHPLSPLSEHTSKTSLPSDDQNTSSHGPSSDNPFDTSSSHITSQTTIGPSSRITPTSPVGSPKSHPLALLSIIPVSSPPLNVRRSDSWWSKFYRTSFLENRSLSARRPGALEIRDPNPPPVLGPIRESMHSTSADDGSISGKNLNEASGRGAAVYGADPGKSLTSLRTADTEQIDRMAGTMDVVQRVRTRSRQTTGSLNSELSINTHETQYGSKGQELTNLTSPLEMLPGESLAGTSTGPLTSPSTPSPPLSASSRLEMFNRKQFSSSPPLPLFDDSQSPLSPPLSSPLSAFTATRTIHSPSVTARVRNYERRMSQGQEQPLPTNTRQQEERSAKKDRVTVNYGLAPRPSLFVANPDHRNSRSSDS